MSMPQDLNNYDVPIELVFDITKTSLQMRFLGLSDQILQPGAILLVFRGQAVGGHIDGHTRRLGRRGESSQLIPGEYFHSYPPYIIRMGSREPR